MSTELTQQQKETKIAEACGYKIHEWGITTPNGTNIHQGADENKRLLPDYFGDLNACSKMEEILLNDEPYGVRHAKWVDELRKIVEKSPMYAHPDFKLVHASAEMRAEAFGKILGLW